MQKHDVSAPLKTSTSGKLWANFLLMDSETTSNPEPNFYGNAENKNLQLRHT